MKQKCYVVQALLILHRYLKQLAGIVCEVCEHNSCSVTANESRIVLATQRIWVFKNEHGNTPKFIVSPT